MSAGVSDQMKIPGNTAKNVEERNIPWSQQVDEASYENLDSTTNDDNSASANQNSMQFQYPPFIAKETPNYSWNNKSRKPTNNVESNKKYGKPLFYNNAKRDDFQPNAWGANNARKTIANNASSNFNRPNRTDDGFLSGKLDNRPGNATADDSKRSNAPPPAAAPKKTTWASIASQPAKLTSRQTTLTATSHKKKGPGMPPPPMVPGKHNLDVNTWDSPNNNPPPVPSPPPPIEQPYVEISPLDFSPVVTVVPEHDMLQRPERISKNIDIPRNDDKSSNFNSNFGRVRTSPNGHSRKNWSQQHPLHQNRQQSTVVTAAPARRGGEVAASSGPTNRYGGSERRGYLPAGARSEQESHSYDYRDENSPRNVELTTRSNHEELAIESPQAVLDELRVKNNYNPADIDLDKASSARFFVIKSYSEDDIHRSIKYEIWCSTDHGNKRLDDAFKERHKEGGNILLFFSVNGSGHFCGMAQMMTAVDYNSTSSVWSQDKWKGKFKVKWIYVKDVPNIKLRHIRLENNEHNPVTKSRDTQEVPNPKGVEVLRILHSYKHSTSIFDDFYHYEKKQEEEVSLKKPLAHDSMGMSQNQSPVNRQYNRQNDDRERDRDRDRDGRAGGAQKYFGPNGGNGGGGIGSGSGSAGAGGLPSFRDRNNPHRVGAYQNYNDHRRFESHRTGGTLDYQQQHQQKERDIDADRENSEYVGSRQKFDYQRRDERMQIKHNNRDRDFSDDQGKSYPRFRAGPREMQKDNEYPVADRARGSTDY